MDGMPKLSAKIRRIHGVTELRMRDDPALKRRVAADFKDLAPLLDDYHPDQPSFDELKRIPPFRSFLESWNRKKEFSLLLWIKGGRNIKKAVELLDSEGKPCAVASWSPPYRITFEVID